MGQTVFTGLERLIEELDRAVQLDAAGEVAESVKSRLSSLICDGKIELPADLIAPQKDCYARRLIYRSDKLGYEVIAMTWGPAQGTPLHDHAGIWCVDGVLHGRVRVTQYDLIEEEGDRCRFAEQDTVEAGVGMAGCLIPPFEYHTIENSFSDRPSVTIHVYGGTMDCCTIFEPLGNGWYQRRQKDMDYHS